MVLVGQSVEYRNQIELRPGGFFCSLCVFLMQQLPRVREKKLHRIATPSPKRAGSFS
jgi:hypothetical protein